MKKFVAGMICGAALMLTTSVFADGAYEQITAYLDHSIKVEVDGKKLELANTPVNYDGSTYLPVRELAGAIGLSVDWDEASKTAKLNSGKSPAVAEPGTTTPAEENEKPVAASPAGTYVPIMLDDFSKIIGDLNGKQTIVDNGIEYLSISSIMAAYPSFFFEPIETKGVASRLTLIKLTQEKGAYDIKKDSITLLNDVPYHIVNDSVYLEVEFFKNKIKPLITD